MRIENNNLVGRRNIQPDTASLRGYQKYKFVGISIESVHLLLSFFVRLLAA